MDEPALPPPQSPPSPREAGAPRTPTTDFFRRFFGAKKEEKRE